MKYHELKVGVKYRMTGFRKGIRVLHSDGYMYDELGGQQSEKDQFSSLYQGCDFTPIDEDIVKPIVYLDNSGRYLKHDGEITIEKIITFGELPIGTQFSLSNNNAIYLKITRSFREYFGLCANCLYEISDDTRVFLAE